MKCKLPLLIKKVEIKKIRGKTSDNPFCANFFSPYVNIIYGANASGKTTLATALKELFWQDEQCFSLRAELCCTTNFSLVVENKEVIDESNFLSTIPSSIFKKCYSISLNELIKSDDLDLAELIQKELQGGFNLKTVKEELHFNEKIPSIRIKEYKEFLSYFEEHKKVATNQKDLSYKEEEVANLLATEKEIESKLSYLKIYNQLFIYLKAKKEFNESEIVIQGFDNRLFNLKGDELTHFDKLHEDITFIKKSLVEKICEKEKLLSYLEISPYKNINREKIYPLPPLIRKVLQVEENIAQLKKEIFAQKSEKDALLKYFHINEETLSSIDLKKEDELFKSFQLLALIQSNIAKVKKINFAFGYIALLPIILLMAINPYFSILLTLALPILILQINRAHRLKNLKNDELNLLLQRQKILGNTPFNAIDPQLFISHLKRFQNLFLGIGEKGSHLSFLEKSYQQLLKQFNDIISPILNDKIKSAEDGETFLEKISQNLQQLEDKKSQLAHLTLIIQKDQEALSSKTDQLRSILEPIFTKIDFEHLHDLRVSLKQFTLQKNAFDSAHEKYLNKRVLLNQAKAILETLPNFSLHLLDLSEETVVQTLENLRALEKTLLELKEKKVALQTTLALAKEQKSVEESLFYLGKAKENLRSEWERYCRGVSGVVLLQFLQAKLKLNSSKSLNRAKELFYQLTDKNFELILDDDKFFAYDILHRETKALHQLSSSTKMQLLLAVRLSFLDEIEKNKIALPLFLDEILNTSDPVREEAIMRSLIVIAKQRRQIFYFTAKKDEADRWEALLKEEKLDYTETRPLHIA